MTRTFARKHICVVLFFLKNRHHNKVLTCEVHGDGANEQRYISICYNICPGVRAMQKYMAVSVSLGGRQHIIHSRAAGVHEHWGGRYRRCQNRQHPGQRLAWPCGVRLGGGMSGGCPHAGALKWAVWCGTCQKTPKIGRGRGGVLVQGAHVWAQSFTKDKWGHSRGTRLGVVVSGGAGQRLNELWVR